MSGCEDRLVFPLLVTLFKEVWVNKQAGLHELRRSLGSTNAKNKTVDRGWDAWIVVNVGGGVRSRRGIAAQHHGGVGQAVCCLHT